MQDNSKHFLILPEDLSPGWWGWLCRGLSPSLACFVSSQIRFFGNDMNIEWKSNGGQHCTTGFEGLSFGKLPSRYGGPPLSCILKSFHYFLATIVCNDSDFSNICFHVCNVSFFLGHIQDFFFTFDFQQFDYDIPLCGLLSSVF